MPRDDIVGVDRLHHRHGLKRLLLRLRWNEMEASDDRVHSIDAGYRLRASDSVDDATVAARPDDDQSATSNIVGRT